VPKPAKPAKPEPAQTARRSSKSHLDQVVARAGKALPRIAAGTAALSALAVALIKDYNFLDIDTRISLAAVLGLICGVSWCWSVRERPLSVWLEFGGIAFVAAATTLLMLFILNFATVRVLYPERPQDLVTEADVRVSAARGATSFVLNAYVEGQTSPLLLSARSAGPLSTYPTIDYRQYTAYDRQAVFRNFVRPQEARMRFSLDKPGRLILMIAAVTGNEGEIPTVLFSEAIKWYSTASFVSGACVLAVCGLLLRARFPSRQSPSRPARA